MATDIAADHDDGGDFGPRTAPDDPPPRTLCYIGRMPSDLTNDQRRAFLDEHDEWSLDGETITRTFVFADFNEAMGFVTRVALASEVVDHHPDIDIRWNKVTVALTTHSQGALTSKDLELAVTFDAM